MPANTNSPIVQQLIDAFNHLPGIGKKSATRMAYYLLERNKKLASQLAVTLQQAVEKVKNCHSCQMLTEENMCHICSDPQRDSSSLCIVGTPADVFAIEQAGIFKGHYFVLMGNLSPLDGIGPKELNLPVLFDKIRKGPFVEIILATNTTPEGEVTANYIIDELSDLNIKISRIAYGVPLGGELEYVDGSTLGHAFSGRKTVVRD